MYKDGVTMSYLRLILWHLFERKNKRDKMRDGIFPYGNKQVPPHIVCCDCFGPGWGPMLQTKVWKSIEPNVSVFEFIPKDVPLPVVYPRKYLCEPCIEKRLGHPVTSDELRDCPMNIGHPAYKPHGMD